jgi:hypothetical protein
MSYWLLDVGLYPCKTCRAIRPPQADQPRRETTDVEQKPPPGPPAPTDRSRSPIPADPPAHPRPSADRWRKAGLRAGAAGRPAHPTLDRPVGTSRTSPWHAGHARCPAGRPFRQGADARHPPGHRLRPISSSCGHPAVAGRPRDMADRSTVRSAGHPQFKVTAQPMGLDPVRTAAVKRRTPSASSVRPCVWPAGHGQPCGLLILAMTGQDGNAHARLRPTPAAPERPPAWSPSDVRAVVSGVHDGRHDRTGSGHACPVVSGRTPSPPAGTPAGPEAMRTGERTNGTRGIRTSSIATTTKAARRDTPSPLLWGRRCGLQPRSARRWQHCQRDGNHGSDQAAAWCRSSVQAAPRRTVLHPRAILAQIILTDRSVRNKFGFSFQERRTPGCPQESGCYRWAVYRATRSRPCASVHRPRSCRQSRSLTR